MTATEPTLYLPDRLTVHRRIGYLLRELRVARRALTLVELAATHHDAPPGSERGPAGDPASPAPGERR